MPDTMTPVEPVQPVAPEPQPQQMPPAQPPPVEDDGGLPDEVLEIPAIQAVVVGNPPAVSTRIEQASRRPEMQLIAKNMPAFQEAGFGFYRSLSGELGVIFNQMKISADDIKAADSQGKLLTIAPDFDMLNQEGYVGSLVADFHRNLLSGGIFFYPADAKDPNISQGKLRLLYEAIPLAFIAGHAGGYASDGRKAILDIQPESLHQRTPLFIRNKVLVLEAERFIHDFD